MNPSLRKRKTPLLYKSTSFILSKFRSYHKEKCDKLFRGTEWHGGNESAKHRAIRTTQRLGRKDGNQKFLPLTSSYIQCFKDVAVGTVDRRRIQ